MSMWPPQAKSMRTSLSCGKVRRMLAFMACGSWGGVPPM